MPVTSLTSFFNTASFGDTNAYTRNQSELSLTLDSTAQELSNWKSLLTMSAGGGMFEGGKLAARILLGATPGLCAVPFLVDAFTFAAGAIADTGLTGILQQAFGNAADENETFLDRLTSQGGARLMGLVGMGQSFAVVQLLQGLVTVSKDAMCEEKSPKKSFGFLHHLVTGLGCHFGSGMFASMTGGVLSAVEQRISLRTKNMNNVGAPSAGLLRNLGKTVAEGFAVLNGRLGLDPLTEKGLPLLAIRGKGDKPLQNIDDLPTELAGATIDADPPATKKMDTTGEESTLAGSLTPPFIDMRPLIRNIYWGLSKTGGRRLIDITDPTGKKLRRFVELEAYPELVFSLEGRIYNRQLEHIGQLDPEGRVPADIDGERTLTNPVSHSEISPENPPELVDPSETWWENFKAIARRDAHKAPRDMSDFADVIAGLAMAVRESLAASSPCKILFSVHQKEGEDATIERGPPSPKHPGKFLGTMHLTVTPQNDLPAVLSASLAPGSSDQYWPHTHPLLYIRRLFNETGQTPSSDEGLPTAIAPTLPPARPTRLPSVKVFDRALPYGQRLFPELPNSAAAIGKTASPVPVDPVQNWLNQIRTVLEQSAGGSMNAYEQLVELRLYRHPNGAFTTRNPMIKTPRLHSSELLFAVLRINVQGGDKVTILEIEDPYFYPEVTPAERESIEAALLALTPKKN